jgi:hypothetical protein
MFGRPPAHSHDRSHLLGERSRLFDIALASLLVVAVLGSSTALGGASAAGLLPESRAPSTAGQSALVAEEAAVCTQLQSNTSLDRTYAYAYNITTGNQSITTNQSNVTEPPSNTSRIAREHAGSYPNDTVGGGQLIAAWISICDSPEFQSIYTAATAEGDDGVQTNLGLNASSGIFQASYSFIYLASCNNPSNFSSTACEWVTNWYVTLTNGTVQGPITTSGGPGGGSPGPIITSPGPKGGAGVPPLIGLPGLQGYVVVLVIAAAIGGLVAARLRTRGLRTDGLETEAPPSARTTRHTVRVAGLETQPRVVRPVVPTIQVSDDPLDDVY